MFFCSLHGKVNYCDGECTIDGVPGKGSPILMKIFEITGGATGKLFPTGNPIDIIDDIEVSMVDAGNLMVHILAEDFGLKGTEQPEYFVEHPEIMEKIESIRQKTAKKAGLGDVSNSVLPKVGLLSKPRKGGSIKSQYFTPKTLHPTHAVSGAVCISTASKAKGTVASKIAVVNSDTEEKIIVEHPSGMIPIQIKVDYNEGFKVISAGTLRTVRKLMDGQVYF